MSAALTTAEVWTQVERQLFAVVAFVTARGEARSAGVVYLARERRAYFCTETDAWKTRHLRANPSISVTVAVPKRVPFMPWLKIPPATITFSGTARVLALSDVPAEIPDALLKGLEPRDAVREHSSVVEVTPAGHFLTYGIGVSLKTMMSPMDAGGRVPVS